jgi:coenzyme PQQ synthesis protein D (PqqD)
MTLRLRDRVSTSDTEYGIVLLDEDSGEYWNLNPTGALVVRTLLDGGSTADAVRTLTVEYAVDPGTARADVDELVDGLRSAGLVTE